MNYQILRIRLLLATPLSIAVAIGCIGLTAEGVDDDPAVNTLRKTLAEHQVEAGTKERDGTHNKEPGEGHTRVWPPHDHAHGNRDHNDQVKNAEDRRWVEEKSQQGRSGWNALELDMSEALAGTRPYMGVSIR